MLIESADLNNVGDFGSGDDRSGRRSTGSVSRTAPGLRERDDMSDRAKDQSRGATVRRWGIDLAVLFAIGLLMGFLSPFGSEQTSVGIRYLYWVICIVGGGVIWIVADELLRPRIAGVWRRLLFGSVVMTPPVTLLVMTTQHLMVDGRFDWPVYWELFWQVWPIMLAVMTVRALIWRRPATRVETRTVIAPPLPEAEAAFRRRLSARRRGAPLIAVEAHDHYLKVHTDAGTELLTLRFADALADLAFAHGWRVHRSWWIAADAVEAVHWRRGTGEAHLVGGLIAPVSRTHAAMLKEAGWR